MKKYVNKQYVEMTTEEIATLQAEAERQERERWLSVSYDDAVNDMIRTRYSLSQELAIERQRFTKPEEHKIFDDWCEYCKAYVKQKKEGAEKWQY